MIVKPKESLLSTRKKKIVRGINRHPLTPHELSLDNYGFGEKVYRYRIIRNANDRRVLSKMCRP
jgi:hypothetical protein